ncbi:protein O-glucosyltransferase 1-like isoform X2 [Clavelina lepadiformis]
MNKFSMVQSWRHACIFLLFVSLFSPSSLEKRDNNKWKSYLERIERAKKDYKPCKGNCTCHSDVITADLKIWKERGGITEADMKKGLEKAVHYQIIDHKLYRAEKCLFPSRCKGVEHFILQIIDELPNMDLGINVHDWPRSMRHGGKMEPLPVFSFSKVNVQHYDIMYPAWTFWQGGPAVSPLYPTGLGRWDLMRKDLAKKAEEFPWDKKENIGFFRGSRTSAARDPLILLSREKPDLVDAQYTKNQAWKSKEDTLGAEPASTIHLVDHCKYKYLFNFRGVAASFRLKHLFLCNSLVFHVGDEWLEFFYPALKPWVHYIPVSDKLKEVEELLLFAKENDDAVKQIASRGKKFIWNRLKMEDVSCYWSKLLKEYASLLTYKVIRNEDLQLVTPEPEQRRKKSEL